MIEIKFFFENNKLDIFGYIFFVSGLVLLTFFLISFLKSNSSKYWKKTKGIITRSKLYKSNDNYDSEYTPTYRPDIEYKYVIDDVEFLSSKLYFGSKILSTGKYFKSKRLVKKYCLDKEIDVYYNPDKKEEAVLEPGVHSEIYNGLIIAIIFLFIANTLLFNKDLIDRFLN